MRLSFASVFLCALAPISALGQGIGDRIAEHHYAYIPPAAGPFPALIAIPGCSGISTEDAAFENSNPGLQEDDLLFRRHYRTMAERLRDRGFAVYLIDVHRAEGVLTACAGEISRDRLAGYISAAISWTAAQSIVRNGEIHLIGWSMGGGGVLEWLNGPGENAGKVKSAIVVYPACNEAADLTVRIPLLMLLGDADDIAEPGKCEELVRNATAGEQVRLKIYPGARHGFDIEGAPPSIDIGGGMTVGYQRTAADDSWHEILSFLERGD